MPTSVTVATSPVPSATPLRQQRTTMFRGRRRQAIKRALNALRVVMRQDDRERSRAIELDYDPSLVSGDAGTFQLSAFQTVVRRLAAAMTLHWGDE